MKNPSGTVEHTTVYTDVDLALCRGHRQIGGGRRCTTQLDVEAHWTAETVKPRLFTCTAPIVCIPSSGGQGRSHGCSVHVLGYTVFES